MNQGKQPNRTNDASLGSNGVNIRRIKSCELFVGHKQVVIEHGCDDYMLRLTRQGKLILTK